jgi:hypothetical protein
VRRRPPRDGRDLPIGHAIAAMFVAFGLTILLSADGMLATARSLPYGSTRRAVAVGIMTPIQAVTSFLQLDRPRQALDWALGHEGHGTTGDPFAVAAPAKQHRSKPVGHETRTSAPPPTPAALPRPTRKHPVSVLVVGDSTSFAFGDAFYQLAAASGIMRVAGPVDYEIGTGLARPDVFDWPAELRSELRRYHPSLVLLMIGLNDDQGVQAPDGQIYQFGTAGWAREYGRRVGAMMDIVLYGQRRRVVYVGPPILSDESRNWHYQAINEVIQRQAHSRARAAYVDAYSLLAAPGGGYAQYLRDPSGHLVAVRTDDGIHLQPAGANLLAEQAMRVIGAKLYQLPRSLTRPPTLGG